MGKDTLHTREYNVVTYQSKEMPCDIPVRGTYTIFPGGFKEKRMYYRKMDPKMIAEYLAEQAGVNL